MGTKPRAGSGQPLGRQDKKSKRGAIYSLIGAAATLTFFICFLVLLLVDCRKCRNVFAKIALKKM